MKPLTKEDDLKLVKVLEEFGVDWPKLYECVPTATEI